ncbi:TraX family protein [Pseudomonas indica]|uniref:TraX family protein n=1 Tax=Pseudomonas indica TaxID=137658 RepID=UPI003FD39030
MLQHDVSDLTACPERAVSLPRDAALDLIKWLAMLSMVLDHLRHVWFETAFLYVPGRLAFPFFCLAIAVNVARPVVPGHSPLRVRYLGWLLAFAVLSEFPYRLLVEWPGSLNVLPTLALGMLIANAMARPGRLDRGLGLAALLLAAWFHEHLMFGLFGAVLPAAFLLALRGEGWKLLPGVICLAANYWWEIYARAWALQPFAWLVIATCFVAPFIGLWLLRHPPLFPVPPMRRWAYLLYPGHFLALWGLREWLVR